MSEKPNRAVNDLRGESGAGVRERFVGHIVLVVGVPFQARVVADAEIKWGEPRAKRHGIADDLGPRPGDLQSSERGRKRFGESGRLVHRRHTVGQRAAISSQAASISASRRVTEPGA